MANIRVKTAGDIAHPPKYVFDYVTDVETWPRWIATISRVQDISERPLTVNATFKTKGRYFALPYTATNTVIELEPGRRFVYTISGKFPGQCTYLFTENANEGTHLTAITELDLSGAALLFAPMLMATGKLQNDSHFKKLKTILEGQ
jgi:uncharacterized protein YndB with AHSA1/START domain